MNSAIMISILFAEADETIGVPARVKSSRNPHPLRKGDTGKSVKKIPEHPDSFPRQWRGRAGCAVVVVVVVGAGCGGGEYRDVRVLTP